MKAIFFQGKLPRKGVELTIADIPMLAPYLKDDYYELIVSFWRDFAADRYLGTTRGDVGQIIDGLAHADICQMEKFSAMSDAEQDEQIKKIIAWAEANKNKTDEQLVIERVQAEIDHKADWRQVEGYVEQLAKAKNPRALGFVEHYLADPNQDAWSVPTMLDDVQLLDKEKAVGWARKFLAHKDARLRLHSALMVLEAGDKQAAIPIIATTLPVGSEREFGTLAYKAANELLDIATPDANSAAATILTNPDFHRPDPFEDFQNASRPKIIARLAKAGHPEGFKIYLTLLDVKGNQFGQAGYGEPPAKQAVTEILDSFGKDDPDLGKAREMKDFESKRSVVRQWVEVKLRQ